jgi:hypothetical protein
MPFRNLGERLAHAFDRRAADASGQRLEEALRGLLEIAPGVSRAKAFDP